MFLRYTTVLVKPGGHVIVSTFGPEGPTKCSGLDVVRYDAKSLHREFGVRFRLLGHSKELIAHRSIQSNSFFIVSAGWNERSP
jgi:hypothetical protein